MINLFECDDKKESESPWKKRFERERIIRKKSEELLEQKSLELFQANLSLQDLNKSLEDEIDKRMEEIISIHTNTKDSIRYASLIQKAIIPEDLELSDYFSDYFMIWNPKDIVGGDIYLFEDLGNKNEAILMVIDCTGHGVPGAFVTMLVKAIERQIIAEILRNKEKEISPSWILSYFNREIKTLLKQNNYDSISNVGFDGGIIYYNKEEKILKFSGAETPLFYLKDDNLSVIKGSRHSIGYKKSDINYQFEEHIINVKDGMKFYLTTDGYLDQNGGEKGFPLGKKRFKSILERNHKKPLILQKKILIEELELYQLVEDRNDDITVVGIQI